LAPFLPFLRDADGDGEMFSLSDVDFCTLSSFSGRIAQRGRMIWLKRTAASGESCKEDSFYKSVSVFCKKIKRVVVFLLFLL